MTTDDPARIVTALRTAGWQVACGKKGVYVRLAWPDAANRSLLVPLDRTAPEYPELLDAVVSELEAAVRVGDDARRALDVYQACGEVTATAQGPKRRIKVCVENWPDCYTGGYDPRCCRFPKSCSATVYDPDQVLADDLEPA